MRCGYDPHVTCTCVLQRNAALRKLVNVVSRHVILAELKTSTNDENTENWYHTPEINVAGFHCLVLISC